MPNNYPNVSVSDWKAFLTYSSPFVFSEIVERGIGDIRWDLLPHTHGVAVASDYLLRMAGHRAPQFTRGGYITDYFQNFASYRLRISSILDGSYGLANAAINFCPTR